MLVGKLTAFAKQQRELWRYISCTDTWTLVPSYRLQVEFPVMHLTTESKCLIEYSSNRVLPNICFSR